MYITELQATPLTEAQLDTLLEDTLNEAGIVEPLSKLPDPILRAELEQLLKDNVIWPKKEEKTGKVPKFFFKFNEAKYLVRLQQQFGVERGFESRRTTEKSGRERNYIENTKQAQSVGYWIRFISSGSGSVGGKVANKGIAFEGKLVSRLLYWVECPLEYVEDQVVVEIMKAAGIEEITNAITVPGSAEKRVDLDGFITDGKDASTEIGATISDVTLFGVNKRGADVTTHISCKSGKIFKYANTGIQSFLPTEYFTGAKPLPFVLDDKGNPKLDRDGKPILDKNNATVIFLNGLGLDTLELKERFFALFFKYWQDRLAKTKAKVTKEWVDLTDGINSDTNKILERYMRRSIGYGYLMCHEVDGKILVRNATKGALFKDYGGISKAMGDFGAGKKQFTIQLTTTGGKRVNLVIRNTKGGDFPNMLMIDYVHSK